MVVNPSFSKDTAENITLRGNVLLIGVTIEESAVKVTAITHGNKAVTRDLYITLIKQSMFQASVPEFV